MLPRVVTVFNSEEGRYSGLKVCAHVMNALCKIDDDRAHTRARAHARTHAHTHTHTHTHTQGAGVLRLQKRVGLRAKASALEAWAAAIIRCVCAEAWAVAIIRCVCAEAWAAAIIRCVCVRARPCFYLCVRVRACVRVSVSCQQGWRRGQPPFSGAPSPPCARRPLVRVAPLCARVLSASVSVAPLHTNTRTRTVLALMQGGERDNKENLYLKPSSHKKGRGERDKEVYRQAKEHYLSES